MFDFLAGLMSLFEAVLTLFRKQKALFFLLFAMLVIFVVLYLEFHKNSF